MKNKLISLIISLTFITPCAAAFAAEDNLDSGSDENVIFQEGFENAYYTFWTTGTCFKNFSESNPNSGAKCLSVTNRTHDWEGIETDLKNKDKKIDLIGYGAVYEAEAWVRLDNMEAENAEFCMQICVADEIYTTPDEFLNVGAKTVRNGEWAQIKGLFSTVGISSTARVSLRIGAYGDSNNKNDFSVDDVIVRKSDQDVQGWSEREDFENKMDNNKGSLKDAYSDDFMLGAARSSDWGELSDAEDELIKKHFDIITLTNAMKPDALSTHEGRYMWGTADYIVNKSLNNNVKVHGHVLAWHQQTPKWIWNKLSATTSEKESLDCLRTYITDVMTHYNRKCYSWDVVNEAIKDGLTSTASISDILRDSPWRTALGDDWVYKAFLIAKEIAPNAVLYYNDYGVEDPIKTEAVYTLVKDVNDKYKNNNKTNNNLIDGIGVQGHFNMGTNINMVRNMLEKFKELGVKVSISEMDIAYYGAELDPDGTLNEEDEIKQAQKYAQLMQLFKEYGQSSESKLIERVSFWGTDDNTSWLKEYRPLLFNKDFSEKEAFEAVLDPEGYLDAHPITETGVEQAVAIKGNPKDAEDAKWNNVPSFNINKRKQPLQDGETAASATVKSMWDGKFIYLRIDVTDSSYSSKDKVVVFLDERNNKNSCYDYDDVFFEIGRDYKTGNVTFGGTWEPYWERSAECTKTDHGYLVYLKIPTTSEVKVDESGNAVLNPNGYKAITPATHHTRPGVVGFEVKIDDYIEDDNNNDVTADYEIFFNQIDGGLYDRLSTAGELALTNNGVAGVVKEVVKQQGAHNSVATGFRAETRNHSSQDITFNKVIWDIKATDGVMKTTGEQPLKTNVTLKPGAFTYISLIVDGLYDYAEARMYVID